MMQALLQQELGNGFLVESAGVSETAKLGQHANDHSVLCMLEREIDITGHVSQWVGDLRLTQYSHIVCVGENEAIQVAHFLSLSEYTTVIVANGENGGVPNPYEKGLPAYRECLDLLDQVIPSIALMIR